MGGCRRAEPRPSLEIEPSIHQDSPSTGGATAILIAIVIALGDISIADGIALAGRRRYSRRPPRRPRPASSRARYPESPRA